jgi:acyl-CoA synthetase (AMP-forming)/AMP-acid ligase II
MFLATVKAMPDQAAIYYFDQTMSYGELDRKSTALAAALKDRGVVHSANPPKVLGNVV